jgi:hypothetical protein
MDESQLYLKYGEPGEFANKPISPPKLLAFLKEKKKLSLCDLVYILRETINHNTTKVIDLTTDKRQFRVVSDLHGSIESVFTIFDKAGEPSRMNPYIVLGDILDKGEFGPDIMALFSSMKQKDPESVYITKGNHELDQFLNKSANGTYPMLEARFQDKNKANTVYGLIRIHCDRLSLCVRLPNAILVHAAIPVGLDDRLENITPPQERFMLWTDVHDGHGQLINTDRLAKSIEEGCSVGHEDMFQCMARHQLKYLIRGHQYFPTADVKQKGSMRIVTIASSPYRQPLSDHTSFVTMNPDQIMVHNVSPNKNIYTAQILEHCVFARISHRRLIAELKSLPGVSYIEEKLEKLFSVRLESSTFKDFLLKKGSLEYGLEQILFTEQR